MGHELQYLKTKVADALKVLTQVVYTGIGFIGCPVQEGGAPDMSFIDGCADTPGRRRTRVALRVHLPEGMESLHQVAGLHLQVLAPYLDAVSVRKPFAYQVPLS